jgi:phosphatidylinositol glycan class O
MENGEIFTSIEDIAAEAKAKAEKQRSEQAQLGGPKPTVADVNTAKKAGEVHFKAQHGIVVAFFSFILYVRSRFSS